MAYRKFYGKYIHAGYNKDPQHTKESFRVKSPVRSFRDLEVYQQTNLLSSKVYRLEREFNEFVSPSRVIFRGSAATEASAVSMARVSLAEEWSFLKKMSRQIPVWITESYSEKFTDLSSALGKLEDAVRSVSLMTARFDFLLACLDEKESGNRGLREQIQGIITGYSRQKIKILNLKKAWARVFSRYKTLPPAQPEAGRPLESKSDFGGFSPGNPAGISGEAVFTKDHGTDQTKTWMIRKNAEKLRSFNA
ncbi:MAG: hypothetical protein V1913_18735 [Fibrobacterota bacterium]